MPAPSLLSRRRCQVRTAPRKSACRYGASVSERLVWPYSGFGQNKPTGVLKATPNPRAAITNQPVLLKATGATEMNLRFPGQYFDQEAGTFYNYLRDAYDPLQGRYRQADPIGMQGGWNRYPYAENAPLMFTDPEGLRSNGPASRGTYYPRGAMPQPPTFPRPDNASQAAGYFNPDGSWTCLKWNCPGSSDSCRPNDLKLSTDFMPPQTNPMSPPSGCTCAGGPNWNRDFGLPRPYGPGPVDAARDLADMYNTLRPILKPR
jgi:RHS repeat-associated protein